MPAVVYTREILDQVQGAEPGCGPDPGPLFLTGRCHPQAPAWVRYADGNITLLCSRCGSPAAIVAVAGEMVLHVQPQS